MMFVVPHRGRELQAPKINPINWSPSVLTVVLEIAMFEDEQKVIDLTALNCLIVPNLIVPRYRQTNQ